VKVGFCTGCFNVERDHLNQFTASR
jgi:hypothetical protein